jgi:arylsulfatase A-like enzyme
MPPPRPTRLTTSLSAAAVALALLATVQCRSPFARPAHRQRLLTARTVKGTPVQTGRMTTGGETRPALLHSASFKVRLPRRAILTFGVGLAWAGQGEAPGWFHFALRSGSRELVQRTLNPRVAHGWRDVSVPLDDLGRTATLDFELRFTDRDGNPLAQPPELLLGVADPIVHDLEAYGTSRGVLLVSIDTLRRDHVGVYGYERPTTPRLDDLANSGILCEDAVSTSSWTLPAHVSMLTSRDPGTHGAIDIEHGFNHRVPTLPGAMRESGFATEAVTSHLYVSGVYGVDDGFDNLDFQQDRKATDVANRAIELLDRLGDQPFLIFLHFYDPHWHYDPPESTRALFERPYTGKITGLWRDFKDRTPKNTTAADLDHLLDLYDGEIRYVDDELGRVLDQLKVRGLDRSTLVVVASDHGEEFLEHGSWEHQKTLYEEVIRVPLMIAGPGIKPRREPAQTSILDVLPTILEWAQVPVPAFAQGRSLLTSPGDREAYGETDHTADGTYKFFLRAGQTRWKTILSNSRERGASLVKEEWYDLSADPRESRSASPRTDVSDAIRIRARDRWQSGRDRGTGSPVVHLSAEQKERLRALGYVNP